MSYFKVNWEVRDHLIEEGIPEGWDVIIPYCAVFNSPIASVTISTPQFFSGDVFQSFSQVVERLVVVAEDTSDYQGATLTATVTKLEYCFKRKQIVMVLDGSDSELNFSFWHCKESRHMVIPTGYELVFKDIFAFKGTERIDVGDISETMSEDSPAWFAINFMDDVINANLKDRGCDIIPSRFINSLKLDRDNFTIEVCWSMY